MDQIKLKYRRFRLPIIDEKEIRYLFEDDDPDILTSDLPQDQQTQVFRPFEKATDKKGEPGLLQTETGRFFYNLDITTIEKRLSNGYYKRPKDYTADVKKLAKDARTVGDEERQIKAKELFDNVEVDMNQIGFEHPQLVAELENVYKRELEREKEMVERAKQRAREEGRKLDSVMSNVPPQNTMGSSTDASTGPIRLGEPLTNGLVHHPITPSNPSSYSNDITDLSDLDPRDKSNSTSIPSQENADVEMTNSDEMPSIEKDSYSSFGPSAQTRPMDSYTGPPRTVEERKLNPNDLSQRSFMTSMAPGSQPADYTNDASTTSSDKRNTGSSADKDFGTQSQNLSQSQSFKDGPDLSEFHTQTETNSQLPDTASNTQTPQSSGGRPDSDRSDSLSQGQRLSQTEQSFSQTPTSTPILQETSKAALANILNEGPPPGPQHMDPTGLPPVVIDRNYTEACIHHFSVRSSGCSVEQLEQLYSAIMSEVWNSRHEWNRRVLMETVKKRFDEEVRDIEELQGRALASQEEQD